MSSSPPKAPVVRHLYLHIPFCAKICPYCAFHVHRGGRDYQQEFVTALVKEIVGLREQNNLRLETVYFGGGTPSLLQAGMLEQICAVLPECHGERTMEVNPKTVTAANVGVWSECGFNRISLGAQSFNVDYLKILGRDHTPPEIVRAVERLKEGGLTNISLDLMFALPNQPREVWRSTLRQALGCRPTHISCYGLTYEEDTPFFKSLAAGAWKLNEEDEIWMFSETERILEEAGIPFYEISNFARPGFESKHNQAYWLGKDYFGCGPSAYSTVGDRRWQNLRDTRKYIEGINAGTSVRSDQEELSPEVRQKERIMFGLRMREGIPADAPLLDSSMIASLQEEGLVKEEGQRLKLTSKGRLVADGIAGLMA